MTHEEKNCYLGRQLKAAAEMKKDNPDNKEALVAEFQYDYMEGDEDGAFHDS